VKWASALLLLLFAVGSAAQTPLATSIGGFNVSNAMLLYKIKDRMANLAPPSYTWPAGNVGDEFPLDRAVLDYLRLQQKFLPAGVWFNQFNLFQGTQVQALEQVRLARELGVRTDVWTVGNEADLYGANRGDFSWTPQKYAAVFRQWATALKAAYPDILISGPAISQPKDDWMQVFIAECGDLVDVLSWHWYPTGGKASDAVALRTSENAGAMVSKYQGWLLDPQRNPRGYKRVIPTAVTEFALHWDSTNPNQLDDMVGACWTADVLGRFAEAGLNYSHFFCLQEYGGHAIFSPGNKPRVLYWVFDFYKTYAQAARFVRVPEQEQGLVTAHGWADARGRVTLVITNRSEASVAGYSPALEAGSVRRVLESRQLTETTPVPVTWTPELKLTLPAHSVTSLVLGP